MYESKKGQGDMGCHTERPPRSTIRTGRRGMGDRSKGDWDDKIENGKLRIEKK